MGAPNGFLDSYRCCRILRPVPHGLYYRVEDSVSEAVQKVVLARQYGITGRLRWDWQPLW